MYIYKPISAPRNGDYAIGNIREVSIPLDFSFVLHLIMSTGKEDSSDGLASCSKQQPQNVGKSMNLKEMFAKANQNLGIPSCSLTQEIEALLDEDDETHEAQYEPHHNQ